MVMSAEREQALLSRLKEYQMPQNDYLALVSKLPEQDALKVLNISARTGLDLNQAAQNPSAVIDSIISPERFAELQKSNPATYQFLQNDPIYMAAVRSKKNVLSLANLENKNQFWVSLKNGAKNVSRSILGSIKGLADMTAVRDKENIDAFNNMFGMDYSGSGSEPIMNMISTTMDKLIESEALKLEQRDEGWIYDLTETAPQLIAQVIATIMTKGGGGAAFMGSQIAGSEYLKLKNEGISTERSGVAALTDAIIQAPIEQLSLNRVIKAFKLDGAKQKALEMLKTSLTEGMTEWIQQYPESFIEIAARNQNNNFNEITQSFINNFWEITKEGAYQGSIGAAFGFLGGAVKVSMQKQVARANADRVNNEIKAMADSGLDPVILEPHKEYVSPNEKIYVDANAMLQSTNAKIIEQLGVSEEQIQKAASTGQDVEIPLSKYQAVMSQHVDIAEKLKAIQKQKKMDSP